VVYYYAHGKDWHDADAQGFDGPGWYFWDETESQCYGPYETKELAELKLQEYAEWLNTGRQTTMIYSSEQVKSFRQATAKNSHIEHLCDSHEELRKERDYLLERVRVLVLEKATVRETVKE